MRVRLPQDEISILLRREKKLSALSLPVRTQAEGGWLQDRKRILPRHQICHNLNLGLPRL